MFPCIFPIIKDEEEWEKDCCITCIAINPGAKNIIKGTPKTSPLSAPIAKDKTNKNNNDEIKGEKIVCAQTFKNLRTQRNPKKSQSVRGSQTKSEEIWKKFEGIW